MRTGGTDDVCLEVAAWTGLIARVLAPRVARVAADAAIAMLCTDRKQETGAAG